MAEKILSVFIDESGDFGSYDHHAPNYYVAIVMHEQLNDIESDIRNLDEQIINLGYVSDRTDFLSFEQIIVLVAELMIAALGEEIAWRGFFLKNLSKRLPFVPALLITASLFSLCHFSIGSFAVVLYDLFFIVVNAAFYGIVYKRSNNIIVSTISHFLANAVGVIGLILIK